MKKIFSILIFLIPISLFSNEFKDVKTDYFIYSSSLSKAEISSVISFTEELNTTLNWDLKGNRDGNFRRVVIFKNKELYNNYLESLEIEPRDDFTYAMFNNRERNKLILYLDHKSINKSLSHHLTLQYMDTYFNDAPQWLKIGIATYYEDFTSGEGVVRNSRWLPGLKEKKVSYFSDLINSDEDKLRQDLAWLLVDYLYNTKDLDDRRVLWDSLSYLKWSIDDNKTEVVTDEFNKIPFNKKLDDYLKTLMGYKEYMDLGIKSYNEGNYKNSLDYFNKAMEQENKNYSPYYYLGLTYNKKQEYQKAYSNFSKALDNGAPKDITYYSIGLNFYASRDFPQALKYLNRVTENSQSKYKTQAKNIIDEISKY